MDLVKVQTKRGIKLPGIFFDGGNRDTIFIMSPGFMVNIIQDDSLYFLASKLQKNNISTMIAHMEDSFVCHYYMVGSKKFYNGAYNETFENFIEDIDTYIIWAKQNGYKKIILAGYSLGSNKVIKYLAENKNIIDYFILIAPVDVYTFLQVCDRMHFVKDAHNLIKKGKPHDILPSLFGDFCPMEANTVNEHLKNKNILNCCIKSKKGSFDDLKKINIPGSFIIGERDRCTGMNPKDFIEQVNSYTQTKDINNICVIPDSKHSLIGKEDIYAQTVLDCIQNHFYKQIG